MTEGRSWTEIAKEEQDQWALHGQSKKLQRAYNEMRSSQLGGEMPPQLHPGLAVYTASKLSHAMLWRALRADWPEVNFCARWPWQHINDDGTPKWPDDKAFGSIFWEHDYQDVARSNVVLCYAEPQDILRGALVEAGMALGMGKCVITVGSNESFGTWQHHSRVLQVKDLSSARTLLHLMAL